MINSQILWGDYETVPALAIISWYVRKMQICDCHPLYMEWNGQADENKKRCESDRESFGRSMVELQIVCDKTMLHDRSKVRKCKKRVKDIMKNDKKECRLISWNVL